MSEWNETSAGREGLDAGIASWGTEAWRARAVAWLDAQLAERGIARTGVVEQPHLRPWATALRAQTTHGVYWLKASAPGTAFEIRLYRTLSERVPAYVLEPLAIDEARAWIVLPDGGATLGASASGEAFVTALGSAMADYARLQRELAPHVGELVRLGVADMRPGLMPQRFEEALAEVERLVAREGRASDRALCERAAGMRGTFAAWCRELAASPVPPSLDHNDLHPWNMFSTPGAGRTRFYDWGDCVVAHPFASLLVALGFVRQQLGVAADDAHVERVRAQYLAQFADLAPGAVLARSAELACHVAKIARVLTWARSLSLLGRDEASDFARAPLKWLAAVLDPSPVVSGG